MKSKSTLSQQNFFFFPVQWICCVWARSLAFFAKVNCFTLQYLVRLWKFSSTNSRYFAAIFPISIGQGRPALIPSDSCSCRCHLFLHFSIEIPEYIVKVFCGHPFSAFRLFSPAHSKYVWSQVSFDFFVFPLFILALLEGWSFPFLKRFQIWLFFPGFLLGLRRLQPFLHRFHCRLCQDVLVFKKQFSQNKTL